MFRPESNFKDSIPADRCDRVNQAERQLESPQVEPADDRPVIPMQRIVVVRADESGTWRNLDQDQALTFAVTLPWRFQRGRTIRTSLIHLASRVSS